MSKLIITLLGILAFAVSGMFWITTLVEVSLTGIFISLVATVGIGYAYLRLVKIYLSPTTESPGSVSEHIFNTADDVFPANDERRPDPFPSELSIVGKNISEDTAMLGTYLDGSLKND